MHKRGGLDHGELEMSLAFKTLGAKLGLSEGMKILRYISYRLMSFGHSVL